MRRAAQNKAMDTAEVQKIYAYQMCRYHLAVVDIITGLHHFRLSRRSDMRMRYFAPATPTGTTLEVSRLAGPIS